MQRRQEAGIYQHQVTATISDLDQSRECQCYPTCCRSRGKRGGGMSRRDGSKYTKWKHDPGLHTSHMQSGASQNLQIMEDIMHSTLGFYPQSVRGLPESVNRGVDVRGPAAEPGDRRSGGPCGPSAPRASSGLICTCGQTDVLPIGHFASTEVHPRRAADPSLLQASRKIKRLQHSGGHGCNENYHCLIAFMCFLATQCSVRMWYRSHGSSKLLLLGRSRALLEHWSASVVIASWELPKCSFFRYHDS
jgi:hypothetical protein